MKRFFACSFLALVLTGCQSKSDALQIICDAPLDPKIRDAAPDVRMSLAAQKIESELSNSEVKLLFSAMATMAPEARATAFKKELKSVGITKCAMTDVFAGK